MIFRLNNYIKFRLIGFLSQKAALAEVKRRIVELDPKKVKFNCNCQIRMLCGKIGDVFIYNSGPILSMAAGTRSIIDVGSNGKIEIDIQSILRDLVLKIK